MPDLQARRTLVKSPPELWAEVSDAAALARHLGELGEIRITRLEPETTVAWEGDRASGTVELAPAGWGTSVTLTAEPVAAAVETAEPEPTPDPVAVAPVPAPEPPVAEPASPVETGATSPATERRSRLVTLLGRLRRSPAQLESGGSAAPEPVGTAPQPEAAPADPEPVAAAPEPAAAEPAEDPLLSALTSALDSLGSAHHRPFSRA